MASTRFYFDCRHPRSDGMYPLKIALSHRSNTRLIHLGVFLRPEEWDDRAMRIVGRGDKTQLNTYITRRKQEVDVAMLRVLEEERGRTLSATQLKGRIEQLLAPKTEEDNVPTLARHLLTFSNQHTGRTRDLYLATHARLHGWLGRTLDDITFEEVDKTWLMRFDRFLALTSPSKNARNIHLRNLRAVFNDAIDNDLTTAYPFRKFPIRAEETLKRSLTLAQLRELFACPCEKWQRKYVDMFKLTFFLIGINVVDLFRLKEIVNGRVEYYRAKTHKLYSIKVEPEAREIIECYKGKTALLSPADTCKNYRTFAMRLNSSVQRVGSPPLFPHITTYWMRHTWATIAAALDIPVDTISRALGHSQTTGARVTSVYIAFDRAKVDAANRRVLDWVLYGKK